MTIDDPVEIAIRQSEEAIAADSYLPAQLVKLGFSAVVAGTLATMPGVAQIITSLLTSNLARFERRFLWVAKELNAQQKRIEDKIPDIKYYESEEFQSLLGIVVEKLYTTHDETKLRMFGDALANCGNSDFQADDKEEYVRTLRDLSSKDLQVLNDERLKGWSPHIHAIQYDTDVLTNLSRLAGRGLVIEHLKVKTPSSGRTGSERLDAENVLRELLTTPPMRTYSLSPFGERFLKFIASGTGGS
jgi:hypothetical protein